MEEKNILFHFSDFTRENYRHLIRKTKEKYRFATYTDFSDSEKFVLWRHDVDFSVHSARRLARIEAEEGVRATYFLHLHSDFYNLFEVDIVRCVRDIIDMGHSIGLHFDSHFYGISTQNELGEKIKFEQTILEQIFGLRIEVFSFHNTTPFTMSCTEWQYGGLINTYADYFQKQVTYCSDSTGYWRYKRLEDVIDEQHERLHILTHPEWWQDVPMSPRARVQRCAEGRLRNSLASYDRYLLEKGFENVGVEEFVPE